MPTPASMRMSPSRPQRALFIAAAAVLLFTGALAIGLSTSRSKPSSPTPSQAQIDRLKQAIQAITGVQRLDGGYVQDASNPGGALVVSITTQPGSDTAVIATEAIRQTWLSPLRPLTSATVTVGPADNPQAAIIRHADFKLDQADLTAKYGTRPQ